MIKRFKKTFCSEKKSFALFNKIIYFVKFQA